MSNKKKSSGGYRNKQRMSAETPNRPIPFNVKSLLHFTHLNCKLNCKGHDIANRYNIKFLMKLSNTVVLTI